MTSKNTCVGKSMPGTKRMTQRRDKKQELDKYKIESSTMEEPKALLPNGHSDKPEQMEVDEVEPKMKDDVKPEPKRTKSTDSVAASDESSESIVKNKTSESSEETNRAGSENDEKSASKKKVPQKIVKRSPRISRNKEPPEKDNEARRSRSEDKDVEKKNDDKPAKLPSIEEENVSKEETDEVKKEQKADKEKEKEEDEEEEVVEVAASEEKAESATIKETEKNDEDSNKEKEKEIQFTGDPDADFLGFDDPTETKYTSYRDKFQRMIDELTASTPGPSRSRRSVLKNVETDQVKASTSGISNVKKEPELEGEEHLSDWFDRKMSECQSSQLSYYDGSGDYRDDANQGGCGVSNAMLIPEVVYMSAGGGGPSRSSAEDDSRSRRSRSSVGQTDRKPSPVVKRNYDVTLPQYMKPFEYGWKRELSYRNNAADSVSKRMADIFYYTPLGKKIRSIGQVRDYLLGTDLTLENFTFVTKAMNLNDPSKETIRDPRKKVVEETPPPPPPATRRSLTASKTPKPVNSVESAVDKAEESATSTTPSLKAASSSTATTPKISLKSFRPPPKNKAKPPVPEKKVKKANEDSESEKEELEMGMLPPLWKSPIQSDWSANGSTTMEDISTSATKSGGGGGCGEVAASGEDGKVEVCSIRCPRMVGEVPTLACVLCLCLFHPECVAVRRNNYLSYVCKNCKDANKPSSKKPSLTVNHGSPPPLVPINPSKTDTGQSETSPSLHPSSSSPAAAPQLQRLLDCKLPAKTVQQPAKIVGGVTTWLPPSSMIQLTSKSTTTSKMSATPQMMAATVDSSSSVNAMPAQTLWQMNGKRFLYVPKHNVLSVSPAATSTSSDTHNQTAVNTLTTAATNSGGNSVLVSPGSVTMPPIIQNSVPSSFLASSLIAASGGGNSATTPTMSHALIVSSDTKNPNSNSPAGVLLVPCITTSSATGSSSMPPGGASDSSSGGGTQQKFLLVNGPATGNFLIGNLPAAVPTTQPAVPSNEAEKGIKRQLEPVDSESPPAKRTKKTANDEQQSPAPAEAGKPAEATPPPATVTPTLAPPPQQQQPPPSSSVSVNKDYFMTNVSAIYHALLNSFQYLKVQELLRAARVCHMWRDVAMNRSLWHVVRMKNSRVRDWDGLANTLRMTGARHLDMRKMLMPDKSDDVNDMWTKYAAAVDRVNSLWRIDLCRCPASAVERSARANARLQYLSALAIKSSSLDSSAFENCKNLTELRLKSSEKNGLDLQNLSSMKHLTKMKHLSLTTMKSFMGGLAEALENMKDLETLELGECSELTESVATKALPKLKRLQRLRLEKGQGPACPTIAILESVKDLKNLVQLELINFDIKSGFDTTISKCTNLRTLLIIPTYVTQSATTNHLVMEGVSKLSKTLTLFVWGITLELLRVTDLFIDQWEGQKGAVKSSAAKKGHKGDSIPILKPLAEAGTKEVGAPSQVDILQLPKLHKVLTSLLPTTKVKILKVPFSATWRQTVSGPAHIH